jgi:ankyrin repeat protein
LILNLDYVDVNRRDVDSRTPLSYAAERGHVDIVQQLLERGADVKSKSEARRTPLSYGAEKGHDVVVKLLLEQRADREAREVFYGHTPLCCAAWKGHTLVVHPLLENGADIEAKDNAGLTLLSYASSNTCLRRALISKKRMIKTEHRYFLLHGMDRYLLCSCCLRTMLIQRQKISLARHHWQ